MEQNTPQYNDLNNIFAKAAAKAGTSPDSLKQMVQMNPKLAAAINNLTANDIEKINNIINDKAATSKILATPQAQEILSKLKKS